MPSPPPGDLPNPGIEPRSPTLQAYYLPFESPVLMKTGTIGPARHMAESFLQKRPPSPIKYFIAPSFKGREQHSSALGTHLWGAFRTNTIDMCPKQWIYCFLWFRYHESSIKRKFYFHSRIYFREKKINPLETIWAHHQERCLQPSVPIKQP